MEVFNISLPTSWDELTDKQLLLVYSLFARDLSAAEVKTLCLMKWNALCCCTDGEQHLGKGQDIEGDATQQDDDACLERKGLQPLFNFLHAHSKFSLPAPISK